VERIARVLDHKVDLQSAAGKGSHFWVEVPMSAMMPSAVSPSAPTRIETGHLAGMVVLCIDNEPKILEGMETLLGGWGCKVLTAANLSTALAALKQASSPPSGLLVDYHLDEGNGIDAIIDLRWRLGGDLPAILITADRSPAVRAAARARDIPVLNKPVKPAALRALLAQWRVQRVAAAE
jgi:CheY-like chemotaxis protein